MQTTENSLPKRWNFHANDLSSSLQYSKKEATLLARIFWIGIYVNLFISSLLLIVNVWSVVLLFLPVFQSDDNGWFLDSTTRKFIALGTIIAEVLLVLYEGVKSVRICSRGDVAEVWIHPGSKTLYSCQDYQVYCFFAHISRETNWKDSIAFQIYYTLRDWKALLLQAPQIMVKMMTLYEMAYTVDPENWYNPWHILPMLLETESKTQLIFLLLTTLATIIWILHLALWIVAFLAYIPLLFHIRGNLKEYLIWRLSKRINNLVSLTNSNDTLISPRQLAHLSRLSLYEELSPYDLTNLQSLPTPPPRSSSYSPSPLSPTISYLPHLIPLNE